MARDHRAASVADAPVPERARGAVGAAPGDLLADLFPFGTDPAGDLTPPEGARLAFELLGARWNLLLLRELAWGSRRFADLAADLGVPRKTLARRLKMLLAHGLLEREPYETRPPRFEYRLTREGRALLPALAHIARWGEHYLAADGNRALNGWGSPSDGHAGDAELDRLAAA
jgi:DNA-binding HxlR family transcriptional regulator